MTYATDQLKRSIDQVIMESETREYHLLQRILVLEQFVQNASPYLDTLMLINPKPVEEKK